MAFWSDKTLRSKLDKVISPNDPTKVDASGYRLTVGSKVYVTKDLESANNPNVLDLDLNSAIQIPPGQFALISTKEKVTVPEDAIGFISIRARVKFRGLINVSGFHVDPGYSDHLIFSVFNAGPKPIPVQKDDDIFLIWFASLDYKTDKPKKAGNLNGNIPSEFIGEINLQVNSTAALNSKFEKFNKELSSVKTEVNSLVDIKNTLNFWKRLSLVGLPIVASILSVAVIWLGILVKWGISSINNLDVQSKAQEKKIEIQEADINKTLEKLETDYKLLKLSIEESKITESQRKIIESINTRLEDIEKKQSITKQK